MGVFSGKFGIANGVSTTRGWSISEQQASARAIASNTKFGPARRKGVHSWTGSYRAYGGQPSAMPGDLITFTGYTAPDDGATPGGIGQKLSGQAMVDSVAVTWAWERGELLNHVVNFSGHLQLDKSKAVQALDATDPDLDPIGVTKVEWRERTQVDPDPWNLMAAMTQAVLNLSAANQQYVNSDTVVAGEVWTGRRAGNVDWNLSLSQQETNRSTAPTFDIGDDLQLRLYVDAAAFWHLNWGHVRDFTGLDVDREGGSIIGRTINLDMNGVFGSSYGTVTLPDLTVWWPPAGA